MTTEQIRIRLTTQEMQELRTLAEKCGLNATALSSVFVKSAIRAIEENEQRVILPLRLRVDEGRSRK